MCEPAFLGPAPLAAYLSAPSCAADAMATLRASGARNARCAAPERNTSGIRAVPTSARSAPKLAAGAGPLRASPALRAQHGGISARSVAAAAAAAPALGGSGGGRSGSGRGGGGGGSGGSGDWFHRKRVPTSGMLLLAATFIADHLEDLRTRGGILNDGAPDAESLDPEAALAAMTAQERAALVPRRVALFVEPSPFTYVSGYNTRFRNTIAQLVAQGAEVLVVTTGAGRSLPGVPFPAGVAPPTEFAGAQVVGAPAFGCPLYWQAPLSFAASPEVWSRLRSFSPDVVHVTSPGVMLLAAGLYARRLDVPLVMSYHTDVPSYVERYGFGFLKPLLWACIRAAHRAAHLSVAASESLAAVLVQEGAAPSRLVSHWRKAVDCEVFNPKWSSPAARASLTGPRNAAEPTPMASAPMASAGGQEQGSDAASFVNGAARREPETKETKEDEPLLLYVGRLGAEKNVDFLRPLLASVPRARLAIVGDGPARADLEAAFAAEPEVARRVTFAGTLRGAALSAAFASADVFVMPSETETLGFVVLEAMASGLPVVAVAAGGIPDIITQPGANGFLYPPGDAAAASAAVSTLLQDVALRRRVGEAAREESTRWDWAAATDDLLTTQYPRAVAAHRAGLHRAPVRREAQHAQHAAAEPTSLSSSGAGMLAATAKLVALRKVASRARLATGGARTAGKALMRRALTTIL